MAEDSQRRRGAPSGERKQPPTPHNAVTCTRPADPRRSPALLCCRSSGFRTILEGMEPQNEQIAPEIFQAIVAQATASGLTVNDYLSQLLGLSNGHKENGAHEPTPYELVEDIFDSITFDSSVPDPDPSAQPRSSALGQLVAEKLRKQGLQIP